MSILVNGFVYGIALGALFATGRRAVQDIATKRREKRGE
jgi:hypothetical protein